MKVIDILWVVKGSKKLIKIKHEKKLKILAKARKIKSKILKDKREREEKLYKLRLRYLKKAREIRQKKLEKQRRRELKEKVLRHKYYVREKVKEAFEDYYKRVKEQLKPKVKRKVKLRPLEKIAVKEIEEPYITIRLEPRERRLRRKIEWIDEELEELKKPIKAIEEEIKTKKTREKRKIIKLVSLRIYKETKELIRLERKAKQIDEEIERIKHPKPQIKGKGIKSEMPSKGAIRRKIENIIKIPENITDKFVKLSEKEKEILQKIEEMRKSQHKIMKEDIEFAPLKTKKKK